MLNGPQNITEEYKSSNFIQLLRNCPAILAEQHAI
jgi:hypothetical protein